MITAETAVKYADCIRDQKVQISAVWSLIFAAISKGRKYALINHSEMSGGFILKETYAHFKNLGYKFFGHNEVYSRIEFVGQAMEEYKSQSV
jgi:hypothetical protein